MTDMTPDQARAALDSVERARKHVTDEIGLPGAYWWAMAAGWLILGVIGEFTNSWIVAIATLIFGAAHATVASRLLDGRRRSSRLQVDRSVTDRRIPAIVILVLFLAVLLTIGAAFALSADDTGHPTLWAAVIVAPIVGFGGQQVFDALRHRLGA